MIPIEERFPRPSVMGVVNVTPDSFSDGGVHLDPDVAAAAARRMVEEGAAIVDVGGESTRPGSDGVSAEEELRRVVPVLERLGGELPLSIDTSKAAVARAALERGADPRQRRHGAARRSRARGGRRRGPTPISASCTCKASRGRCRRSRDTATSPPRSLRSSRSGSRSRSQQGIPEERICLDPGIGFGKTVAHNLELVRRLDVLLALGRPVLVGFSRKSSLRS